MGARFPVVLDASGQISAAYNVRMLPHNVLIDKSGQIESIIPLGGLEAAAERATQTESN